MSVVLLWTSPARQRAEEALQKAHDKLEEEVKKRTAELAIFRRFAEASGQGFGMADLDGRISYVNPTLCRLLWGSEAGRHDRQECFHVLPGGVQAEEGG